MFLITKNSSKGFLSTISRRLYRGLSSEPNPVEDEEKKVKQQKYQELEKLQYRPLYLDAQATTPMVIISFIRIENTSFY
jgi:hypothetical protein